MFWFLIIACVALSVGVSPWFLTGVPVALGVKWGMFQNREAAKRVILQVYSYPIWNDSYHAKLLRKIEKDSRGRNYNEYELATLFMATLMNVVRNSTRDNAQELFISTKTKSDYLVVTGAIRDEIANIVDAIFSTSPWAKMLDEPIDLPPDTVKATSNNLAATGAIRDEIADVVDAVFATPPGPKKVEEPINPPPDQVPKQPISERGALPVKVSASTSHKQSKGRGKKSTSRQPQKSQYTCRRCGFEYESIERRFCPKCGF